MKGPFSIEWLSQSSRDTASQTTRTSAGTWPSSAQAGLCSSSTAPESLPGFYCSKREAGADARQTAHGSPSAQGQGPSSSAQSAPHNTQAEVGFSSSADEEETSGYESEGGGSPSRAVAENAAADSPAASRRPRTAFTVEQINRLEKAFKKNAYLGSHDKAELCQRLRLSDKQIRNWFQNRRMKLKRTLQDALAQACQAKVASQLMHYPELQAFRSSPYPNYYPVQETTAPYLPPSGLHYTSSPAVGAIPALPVDSLYQFSGLPCLVPPPGGPPLMPYQPYPPHY
ncbi:ventrally expressed dharma/bozozok antagonist isoform X2 [Paramormyrops kingsleyae]